MDRLPPQDTKAEHATIGSMCVSADAVAEVIPVIRGAEAFVDPHCRELYPILVDLWRNRKPISLITVYHALCMANSAMTEDDVIALAESVPSAANARYYAEIVALMDRKRRGIQAAGQLQAACYNGQPLEDAIDETRRTLNKIESEGRTGPPGGGPEFFEEGIEAINAGGFRLIPTGIDCIDQLCGGLSVTALTVIGGYTSTGKSTLLLNIFRNLVYAGRTAALFSLEMSRQEIQLQWVAGSEKLRSEDIRYGTMDPERRDAAYRRVAERVRDRKFFIHSDMTRFGAIEAETRRLIDSEGLEVACIDHVQLCAQTRKGVNMNQAVGEVTRTLKLLALESQCAILAASQLSREHTKHGAGRPSLADLRDSGNIEQDADNVWLLFRPKDSYGTLELNVAKHRMGRTGKLNLAVTPAYNLIESASQEDCHEQEPQSHVPF